jgi:hypothetical protein
MKESRSYKISDMYDVLIQSMSSRQKKLYTKTVYINHSLVNYGS